MIIDDNILIKYLDNQLSDEEMKAVEAWLSSAPDHRKLMEEMYYTLELTERLQVMNTVDTDKAYNQFKANRKGKKMRLGDSFLSGFQKIAAALFIPLILTTGYLYLRNQGNDFIKNQLVEVNTNPGIVSTFELPDGSKVWLNAGSSLKYTPDANADKRVVELEGEGYFEVVKNPEKPFIVKTGSDYSIEVLGTSFNVSAYADDEAIETTLVEGAVKLNMQTENGQYTSLFLQPDQKAAYHKTSKQVAVAEAKTDVYTDWTRGELIFRQEPMERVLKKLNRRYHVSFDIQDPEVYNAIITARFTNETIPQIMEYLSVASGIKYNIRKTEINGDRLTIPTIEIKK